MSVVRSISGVFVASIMSLVLSSCATGKSSSLGNSSTAGSASGVSSSKEIESFHLSDPEGPKVVDEELENIPSEVNPLVEKWITYFKGKGRPHMERYLARSTRYEKLMKKVLRDNGYLKIFFISR